MDNLPEPPLPEPPFFASAEEVFLDGDRNRLILLVSTFAEGGRDFIGLALAIVWTVAAAAVETELATEVVAAAAALADEYSIFTKDERLFGRDNERDSMASEAAGAGAVVEVVAGAGWGDVAGDSDGE